ncbi:MAG: argininosuccinate synthase [Spirochaetales bacterium]|nr:argininosuccinate synthase [Spirochaetales bacterium]
MAEKEIKKIVLAYSGGLDTSIIIPWLKENYNNAEIIGCCTNVGQDEDWEGMEKKALKSGASKLYIKDIKDEFANDFLFNIIRAGAVYEGKYLLGTSIARPLQAKHIAEVALAEGADAICHGCTGKGNDQVRFELTFKALAPNLEVIAPWRVWDISSREEAIDYAKAHNVPLGNITKKNIYSRDWNIWHMSHEGGDLEDPWNRPKEEMFQLTKSPKNAPDVETEIVIDFEKSFPVAINGKKMSGIEIIAELNKLGSENGIGRSDLVETRVVGMKSRGVYETPAGEILYKAVRELEMLTMDADTLSMKDNLSLKYADLIYCGKWYTPVREAIDAFMEKAAAFTTGSVKIVLYKGNTIITGRKSPFSIYIEDLASFGESAYDQSDATGFINLYGLSTGVTAMVRKGLRANGGQADEIKATAATFHDK